MRKKNASVRSQGSSISSNHNSSTESIPVATREKDQEEPKEKEPPGCSKDDDDVISLFTPRTVGDLKKHNPYENSSCVHVWSAADHVWVTCYRICW